MKPAPDYHCDLCHLPIAHKIYGGFIDGRFHYLCRQCHVAQTRDERVAEREKRQEVRR